MTRARARFTQEELARAIRAAESCGKTVRVWPDGTLEIAEKGANTTPQKPLAASREFSL